MRCGAISSRDDLASAISRSESRKVELSIETECQLRTFRVPPEFSRPR